MVAGQQPFATILGCSDSRVPPELLFDQGFGDLFIIRVAGNVVSAEVLGSVQYAGASCRDLPASTAADRALIALVRLLARQAVRDWLGQPETTEDSDTNAPCLSSAVSAGERW